MRRSEVADPGSEPVGRGRIASTADADARRGEDPSQALDAALQLARKLDYEGYSKHDALNARWLEVLAGESRLARLITIQLVMRSPFHVRPLLGVRRTRNAKGLALFARALLARYRLWGDDRDAQEARSLLDWLIENPSKGFDRPCWGYPYPWQDVGFFAPRNFPNRVVTSFVVEALLDGYETVGEPRYRDQAEGAVGFLLDAPATLFEDETRRAVSYVPSEAADWIVVDVSALSGAAVARFAALVDSDSLMWEASRLIRYVASLQTDYGAWHYAEPPTASHISHDNYHTGFILDAMLEFGQAAGSDEFDESYRRGLEFYRTRLFEPDGAPRFMYDRKYPIDIHGCAQGVLTFARAHARLGAGLDQSGKILHWTLSRMYDPSTGWFLYQKRRFFRTRVRLLRWCQAWMAWAIAAHLEARREAP